MLTKDMVTTQSTCLITIVFKTHQNFSLFCITTAWTQLPLRTTIITLPNLPALIHQVHTKRCACFAITMFSKLLVTPTSLEHTSTITNAFTTS